MNRPPPLPNSPPTTGTLATSGAVPPSITPPTPRTHIGKYEVEGEIGRGGMGCVLKGHDPDLGRDLAIKVLHRGSEDRTELVQRFFEEARVSGQLQHPGIVPVHEVGRLPADEFGPPRPYFTMKLVKGDTLADLLYKRPSPGHDLPRFLTIFEQICQTLAYAHAHGVIHRDLKPANVMVGRFGEAQVMDWGLAKVLNPASLGDDAMASRVSSGREAEGWKSRDGAILGTPAYMPPEQARGDADELDERADVFGLGGILCHILTGLPTYMGGPGRSIMQMAIQGDLAATYARLAATGADTDLVDLAKACLAAPREARPRHAGVVAGRIAAYRAGVQERLRAAGLELARAEAREAEAQAKARAERRARRLTLGLAAAILLLGLLGGGTYLWVRQIQRDRDSENARRDEEHRRTIHNDLTLAEVLREQQKWTEALAIVKRTEARLEDADGDELRQRIRTLRVDLELIDRLEQLRFGRSGSNRILVDFVATDREYAEVFAIVFGGSADSVSADEAARRLNASAVREPLVAALDDWASIRDRKGDKPGRNRLLAIAQKADSGDRWRVRFRDALAADDAAEIQKLARQAPVEDLQPATLLMLCGSLFKAGDRKSAIALLEEGQRRHPGDFWINLSLGHAYTRSRSPRLEEGLRYYSVAVAVRPDNAAALNDLANALKDLGRLDEAVLVYRKALRVRPAFTHAMTNLGSTLRLQNKLDEAEKQQRQAIQVDPTFAPAHFNLGQLLLVKGQFRQAEASFRKSLSLVRGDASALYNLGLVLTQQGRLEEADEWIRKAIELDPSYETYILLGENLHDMGRPTEALEAYRKAVAIAPDNPIPHVYVGRWLMQQGRISEARPGLRHTRELVKKSPPQLPAMLDALRMLEDMADLEDKLPAILKGDRRPESPAEMADVAQLCYFRGLYTASVRYFADAFALNVNLRGRNYVTGACSAARAAAGEGDGSKLDETERKRLRQKALEWMRAAHQILRERIPKVTEAQRYDIEKELRQHLRDLDLASVREPAALAKLDATEREEWRKLWADANALLKRVQEP